MVNCIFWDFDGVIAESVNVKTEAFKELYSAYGEEVSSKVADHHIKNGGMSRFEKFPLYHKEFLGKELSSDGIEAMSHKFSEIVLDKVVNAGEVTGVRNFLENHYKEMEFFVVSGTPHDEMNLIVERKSMSHLFKKVMGSPRSKTDWVEEVLSDFSLNPEECVFIGDATSDFKASQNTGVRFILRKTEDNGAVFKDYSGISIHDFVNFQEVIESL